MKLKYLEDLQIVLVQGPYAEKQAYDAKQVAYPPKAAGLGWHKPTKTWIGPGNEDLVNSICELVAKAEILGLPGIDNEEPSA